ncbi:MAG: sugar phosphate isomerase/epimerase [Segetibacter sp.]|nr:sugar phosphate isomerase/epimerase [Segetibacter sp.]
MQNSRRRFFKNAGTGVLACSLSSTLLSGNLLAMNKEIVNREDLFKVGIAGYTFVKFKLEPSLEMTERVGVQYLCIKDFHLPLDSTSEQIRDFQDKLKARNITGYGVGPIYMRSEAEIDKAFDYAKRVGVKLIVGVPEHELLPYVDKKVKEYDFQYAIHNHGVEDKRYPSVESLYMKIKDLDSRIGICHDIGYSAQMGFDPAEVTLKYGHRIYEMHIKDMTKGAVDGSDCVIGRGIVDFPALIKALRKTRYNGKCSIEMASADPLAVIAESVGYFKGVMKAV